MKAYLDYNIFTAIEDGIPSILKIYGKVGSSITEFPFSAAHIQEADNIFADTEEKGKLPTTLHLFAGRGVNGCPRYQAAQSTNFLPSERNLA